MKPNPDTFETALSAQVIRHTPGFPMAGHLSVYRGAGELPSIGF